MVARVLLTSIIGLNLGLVGVNVLQNQANGALFTALQHRNAPGFYRASVIVILLILLYLAVAVLRVYLDQTLQLRWRRWLTDQYVTRSLANRAFYRMRFSGRVNNPDQRISEDVRLFIERSMSLGLGFLNSLATLASFAVLLWYLSGSITLPIGGFAITIPGYMFWVAVLYSGLGSVIAHLIGRPLIRLNNRQQAVEADFRFSLVRLSRGGRGHRALWRRSAGAQHHARAVPNRLRQFQAHHPAQQPFLDIPAIVQPGYVVLCAADRLAWIFLRCDPARRADPDRECI